MQELMIPGGITFLWWIPHPGADLFPDGIIPSVDTLLHNFSADKLTFFSDCRHILSAALS
jgi:hypothetical protein